MLGVCTLPAGRRQTLSPKDLQQAYYVIYVYAYKHTHVIYTHNLIYGHQSALSWYLKSLIVLYAANPFLLSRGRGWSHTAAPALLTCRNTPLKPQPFCFAKLSRPGLSRSFISLFPCREAAVRAERVCFLVYRASNLLFEVACQNHIPAPASSPSRGEAKIRNESRGLLLLNRLCSLCLI